MGQNQRYGGAKRVRTADLNTASVALYQLSYSPVDEATYYSGNIRLVKQKTKKYFVFIILFKISELLLFISTHLR